MSTPIRLGRNDPFKAFVCDDATLDALRPAAAELGFAPEKCVRGGLRAAVQALSVAASPAILIIDLSECSDPLNEIAALEEVCEPGTVVLALGRVNDVRLYRQLVASGVHDYLLKPLATGQLIDALAQAKAVLTAPRPAAEGETAARDHRAVAVVGTRGGVGASTLATSLAWLCGEEHQKSVALLDLDVHFGTAALSLDLEPGRGLIDAISDPGRIDSLFLERAMTRAGDRLAILSAEAPMGTDLTSDGAAFVQLQEEFRQAFDMTIIDLPRNMLVNFPQVVNGVGQVILVAELTLASARDTIRLLAWLKVHAPEAEPVVVVNREHAGAGEISPAELAASIEHAIDHSVPFDPKTALSAARQGQTLAEAGRSTKLGHSLRLIAGTIASGAKGDEDTGKAAAGAGGRFDWKALLSRTPAQAGRKAEAAS